MDHNRRNTPLSITDWLVVITFIILAFLGVRAPAQEPYELHPNEEFLATPKRQPDSEGNPVWADSFRIDRIRMQPEPTLYYSRLNSEGTAVVKDLSMAVGYVFETKPDPKLSYLLKQVKEYDDTGVSKRGDEVVKSNVVPIAVAQWTSMAILEIFPKWDELLGHLDSKISVELSDGLSTKRISLLVQDVTGIASDPRLSDIVKRSIETLTTDIDSKPIKP